jgi:hypothetical protein
MAMTIRSEKWLAASALALEAAAVALACGLALDGPARVPAAAGAHALGVVCAVAFLSRRARRLGLAGSAGGLRLLFATAAAVLPMVGPAALAALLAGMARRHHEPEAALATAGLSDLAGVLPPPGGVSAEIGRGSLEARLRFDPAPASRIAAVLATRRLQAAGDATRLLKLALRDRHEDVRLLAHALLEDRDRQAFQRIEELERALAAAGSGSRGSIACLLAEALCELCASGLVSGELESFTLRRARALLDEARGTAPMQSSAGAALLLARVLLRQGEATAAQAALAESGRLGAPAALLAPRIAEAAFLARGATAAPEVRA